MASRDPRWGDSQQQQPYVRRETVWLTNEGEISRAAGATVANFYVQKGEIKTWCKANSGERNKSLNQEKNPNTILAFLNQLVGWQELGPVVNMKGSWGDKKCAGGAIGGTSTKGTKRKTWKPLGYQEPG